MDIAHENPAAGTLDRSRISRMRGRLRSMALLCVLTVPSALAASAHSAAPAMAPGQPQRPVRSDQDILMQLERDWNTAFHRRDVTFIDSILAEEFIATYDNGTRGDKAKELALAAAFNQQIDDSLLDEFIIKIYGDTAVVWFTLHLTGPMKGVQVEMTYRYVDVFVMRDGRWQCVSSQSTRVPPPN